MELRKQLLRLHGQDYKIHLIQTIILVGHGGNLEVADHISVDITRLTNYKKSTICPGSAILATSYINDTSFDDWMTCWLKSLLPSLDVEQTLMIGISSSGRSDDISNLFLEAKQKNIKTALITAKLSITIKSDIQVVTTLSRIILPKLLL